MHEYRVSGDSNSLKKYSSFRTWRLIREARRRLLPSRRRVSLVSSFGHAPVCLDCCIFARVCKFLARFVSRLISLVSRLDLVGFSSFGLELFWLFSGLVGVCNRLTRIRFGKLLWYHIFVKKRRLTDTLGFQQEDYGQSSHGFSRSRLGRPLADADPSVPAGPLLREFIPPAGPRPARQLRK